MQVTLTAQEAWELIEELMRAAGRLSDLQEMLGKGGSINDALNDAKREIFNVTNRLDPRAQEKQA